MSRRLALSALAPPLAACALVVAAATPAPPPVAQPERSDPVTARWTGTAEAAVLPTALAASGDFRGAGRAQIARFESRDDFSLRILVLDRATSGETFTESVWYTSVPNSFDPGRMKLAVADVNYDGRDDIVVLYDDHGTSVRLLVFLSNGDTFAYTGNAGWWKSDFYAWSRARYMLAGDFSGFGRVGLLIPYQYDGYRMRIHYFESLGSRFAYQGDAGVFDSERSGLGGYDLDKARFSVGRFTRSGGAHQLAAVYQYPNSRIRAHVFDPTPNGVVALNGYGGRYDSGEGQYDLARAKFAASDVDADGRSDLVALYSYADGSCRLHVFSGGANFQPSGGFAGWYSLATGEAVCASSTQVLAADWNGDGAGDAAALVRDAAGAVTARGFRSALARFCGTGDADRVPDCLDRWPFVGLAASGAPTTRRPLYVKIDNNPSARPHYGIAQADMVFEWLVEGFTTRLAAIFHSQEPDTLGSIRSGRHTDRFIIPAYRAVLVYSGAAGEETEGFAYDMKTGRYIDLNAGYFNWSYRVGFRVAPYNMFTTGARVRASAAEVGGGGPVTLRPWAFLPPTARDPESGGFAGSAAASVADLPYRGGFGVRYTYDGAARTYARYQAGVREVDAANDRPIAARNVVVVLTDVALTDRYGLDVAGALKVDMRLTGEGPAIVFRDGRRQEGAWSRADEFSPYAFRNRAGEPILLAPGQTWVHVVPLDWTIPSQ